MDLLPEHGDELMPIPCEQEGNITEIKQMISSLTAEFRGILNEMRTVFVEDREHKIRIAANEKAIQVLFDRQKDIKTERDACMKDKIDPLVDWKNRADGGMSSYLQMKEDVIKLKEWKSEIKGSLNTTKGIAFLCLIVTTLIAVFSFMSTTHEKNDFEDHGLYHRNEETHEKNDFEDHGNER